MRHLRSGRRARALARALTLLMLTPYLGGFGAPRAAQAQLVPTLPVVIVLDFANRTSVGGPLLGRSAAAAVIVEMKAADQWDVVRESVVQDAITRLNLQRPFDRIDLARLAMDPQVAASQVVTGEILGARVTRQPAQASVTLAVRVMDVASRELINGALVTATSAPRPGYTAGTDVLLDEAVNKAAFMVRENLGRFLLPEGTVLNTTVVGARYDALLNIGARQGVKQGMRFVVLRGRDLVGRAQITSVDPDKSVAAVVDNYRGVKPEDRVRAIFDMPTVRRGDGQRAEGEGPVRIAAYAAEVGGPPAPGTPLAQAAPAPDQTEPDIVVEEPAPPAARRQGNTRALRMVGGALAILGIAALAARKGGTEAFSVRADPILVAGQAAIRVRWSRPRQVSHEDVIQYQIVRYSGLPTDFDRVVGVVQGDRREFIDTQHDPIDIDRVFEGRPGSTDISETTLSEVPGIAPGVSYRYAIETVFRPKVSLSEGDDTGTGTGTGNGEFELSQRSSLSNAVVPVAAPGLASPDNAASVDCTNVLLIANPAAGATTYVFQVSTDVGFKRNVRTVGRSVLPPAGLPPGTTVQAGPLNFQRMFPNADQLFWRVGARNDQGPGTSGFVFGNPRMIICGGP